MITHNPYTLILLLLGIAGSAAIIPYSMAMQGQTDLSLKIFLLALLQGGILSAAAVFLGSPASAALGLEIPSAAGKLPLAVVLGAASGLLILGLETFVFLPNFPEVFLRAAGKDIALWKRFFASFYGGITEELLMRFFLLSGLLWLVTRIWKGAGGDSITIAFWIVNIIIAVLFGLGHLPAVKQMAGEITPLLLTRTIVLNSIAGIVFGWLFWHYGLVAAMVSHFTADIVLHVLSPIIKKIVA